MYVYLYLFVVCMWAMQWLTAPLAAWRAALLIESEEEFCKRAKQLESEYKNTRNMSKNVQSNTRIIQKKHRTKNTSLKSKKNISLISTNLIRFIEPVQSYNRERKTAGPLGISQLHHIKSYWTGSEIGFHSGSQEKS